MSTHAQSTPTGPVTGGRSIISHHDSPGPRHGTWLLRVYLWSLVPILFPLANGLGAQIVLPVRPRRGEFGAVSLEQVLWFVAAGLSVAVVAGILWAQIRNQATTPINVPRAP